MSRRSQSTRSSQGSQRRSQTGPSQNCSQLSQTRIDQLFTASEVSLDEQINNCVRYFVNNAGHNAFFRKADVQKFCAAKAGQNFQRIIEKAAEILKNVYGYNLLVCDPAQKSGKAYVISNAMPYKNYRVVKSEPNDKEAEKILLLLILSHLFMSNSPVSDVSLYSFLKCLKIDVNIKHPVFGQVKEYITSTLVKQKMLSMETDPVSKKVMFQWGVRAEKEISKHEVLEFVCKIYKDSQPRMWANQFQAANEQGFENERIYDERAMDIDDD